MIKNFFLILTFLFFFSINNFTQIDFEVYLEDAPVTSITEEEGYLWVATYGQGIFTYSKKDRKWSNFSTKNRNLNNDLFHSVAVNKNYVWAAANEGLFIYDKKKKKWTVKKFALGGQFGNWIRSLCYDPDENILWIGRFRNLTKLDVAKQKYTDYNLTQKNDPKSNTFISIKMDGDSLIWFGTESGVHIYRKKKKVGQDTWQFLNNKKGFKEEGDAVSVRDFLFEPERVWFGTDEFITPKQPQFNIGGLYYYNRNFIWNKYSRENGFPANGVYCLERTGNYIWVGIYSFDKKDKEEYPKGLVMIDRISGKVSQVDLNLLETKTSAIKDLYFDGKDLWIGTNKGLWRLKISNPMAEWTLKKNIKKGTTKR
jgi:ligand-binding sensor domain-containing protein